MIDGEQDISRVPPLPKDAIVDKRLVDKQRRLHEATTEIKSL